MGFNKDVLRRQRNQLDEWGVRIRWSGRRPKLWGSVIRELEEAEDFTRGNSTCTLNMCVNYGGRAEIADAVSAIAEEVAAGRIKPGSITEKTIQKYLDEPDLPDVDLFLRSSGEQRLSNFMLWQSAYAEFVFLDTLWPDVDRRTLWDAVEIYARRDRRYGGAVDAAPAAGSPGVAEARRQPREVDGPAAAGRSVLSQIAAHRRDGPAAAFGVPLPLRRASGVAQGCSIGVAGGVEAVGLVERPGPGLANRLARTPGRRGSCIPRPGTRFRQCRWAVPPPGWRSAGRPGTVPVPVSASLSFPPAAAATPAAAAAASPTPAATAPETPALPLSPRDAAASSTPGVPTEPPSLTVPRQAPVA